MVTAPLKRLIVCFDGTWNDPDNGDKPTNVVKIMRAILPRDDNGTPQITFYDAGVGTGSTLFGKIFEGATGTGVSENIQDGYRFLANNHAEGDEIYIFGFSRGAFTARSLGGFIRVFGLMPKTEMDNLPGAWQYYKTPSDHRRALLDGLPRLRKVKAVAKDAEIKCIGVWDTVGALGIPLDRDRVGGFHDTQMSDGIAFGLHAVAIDEKRGPFSPTLWTVPVEEADAIVKSGRIEQVWFPGVHSNIGGSYPDDCISDLSLKWMIQRVSAKTDLQFDRKYVNNRIRGNYDGEIYDSLSFYVKSRFFPHHREIAAPAKNGEVAVNQLLHWCVEERLGKKCLNDGAPEKYKPGNLIAALKRNPDMRVVGKNGNPIKKSR